MHEPDQAFAWSLRGTSPLPRPNHPSSVPCGWLGRGSGWCRKPLTDVRGAPNKRLRPVPARSGAKWLAG